MDRGGMGVTGEIKLAVPPLKEAEKAWVDAVLVEVRERQDHQVRLRDAMIAREEAAIVLFRARQAWCAEQNAGLPEGAENFLVACRTCLQAVPAGAAGHDLVAESGEMIYARCGGSR